jgi:hypothetical protein
MRRLAEILGAVLMAGILIGKKSWPGEKKDKK